MFRALSKYLCRDIFTSVSQRQALSYVPLAVLTSHVHTKDECTKGASTSKYRWCDKRREIFGFVFGLARSFREISILGTWELTWKMFPLINPLELAIPTMTPVSATRWFSDIELLEYQVESMTLGVFAPIHSRKQAKYATPVFASTSMVPSTMKPRTGLVRITSHSCLRGSPIIVINSGMTTWRLRSRK